MIRPFQPFGVFAQSPRWCIPLVLLGFLLVGCSESRQSQCVKLVAIANQAVEELQATIQANANPNNSAYLKVAETVEQAKTAMTAVELIDPQLQTFQKRFIDMYAALGETARALADAVEKQDAAAAETAQTAFQQATQQEEPLVNEVNTYCSAQP